MLFTVALLPLLAAVAAGVERNQFSFSVQSKADHSNHQVAIIDPATPGSVLNRSDYTILQILDYSLHHEEKLPELYRLARIVNYSSEAQNDLKRDQITLLAPSSKALQPRSGGEAKKHPFYTAEQEVDERDDSRRARFAKIVAYVLRYHTISSVETVEDLTDRSTIPSSLVDHDEALRIRVEPSFSLFPPRSTLKFNYAQTEGLTIFAKNGIIHVINAPLLPPFTPLNDLFLLPTFFSSLTSSLQKVDLDRVILPSPERLELEEDESKNIVEELIEELMEEVRGDFTIFAPTNFAFDRLGLKANAFLQSPFLVSRRVLKYVLAYHIVPDLSFYTDFISNSSSVYQIGSSTFDQSNVTHYELPTLLSKSGVNKNATLLVDVVSYKSLGGRGPIRRDIIVRPHEVEDRPDASSMDASPVRVYKADLVARHGAIHALNSVLIPPHYHHENSDGNHAAVNDGLTALFEV